MNRTANPARDCGGDSAVVVITLELTHGVRQLCGHRFAWRGWETPRQTKRFFRRNGGVRRKLECGRTIGRNWKVEQIQTKSSVHPSVQFSGAANHKCWHVRAQSRRLVSSQQSTNLGKKCGRHRYDGLIAFIRGSRFVGRDPFLVAVESNSAMRSLTCFSSQPFGNRCLFIFVVSVGVVETL